MREFFVFTYDDRDDLEAVRDYDLVDLDLTVFWTGQKVSGSFPESARIWVGNGNPTDFMGNPLSWQIASERLWTIIKPLVGNDCQALSVPLYYEQSCSSVSGYLLLNPTRCLSATRRTDADTDVSISNLVLDLSLIPPDVNMFRLAESSTVILVSDDLVKALWGKQLKGLAFLKTKPC